MPDSRLRIGSPGTGDPPASFAAINAEIQTQPLGSGHNEGNKAPLIFRFHHQHTNGRSGQARR